MKTFLSVFFLLILQSCLSPEEEQTLQKMDISPLPHEELLDQMLGEGGRFIDERQICDLFDDILQKFSMIVTKHQQRIAPKTMGQPLGTYHQLRACPFGSGKNQRNLKCKILFGQVKGDEFCFSQEADLEKVLFLLKTGDWGKFQSNFQCGQFCGDEAIFKWQASMEKQFLCEARKILTKKLPKKWWQNPAARGELFREIETFLGHYIPPEVLADPAFRREAQTFFTTELKVRGGARSKAVTTPTSNIETKEEPDELPGMLVPPFAFYLFFKNLIGK
jgi:hypothetical protein